MDGIIAQFLHGTSSILENILSMVGKRSRKRSETFCAGLMPT